MSEAYIKTQLFGRWQPMTSLPAQPQYKRALGEYIILFFIFTDCFVWSVHSDGKNDFLQAIMVSTSKAFKRCVDPCPRYLTPDDTHNLWVFWLGKEHTPDVLEEAICVQSACTWLAVEADQDSGNAAEATSVPLSRLPLPWAGLWQPWW